MEKMKNKMTKIKILVTGAGGLIGSETVKFFLEKGAEVISVENNMRRYFFGEAGDINANIEFLEKLGNKNIRIDIRDRESIFRVYKENGPFNLIVHAAAQPSHDWSRKDPLIDFDINAVGTLNLLEGFRLYSPNGVFIFTSTNKVYGDTPNRAELIELEKRYEFRDKQFILGISSKGINEEMPIDNCIHSIFGASKAAADILAQEYGKYFNLNVGIFRGGCLTGPRHSAVELHGFLAYIVDCALNSKPYIIYGYKGKQVRDQIHSRDVVRAFYEFYLNPKKGIVYNLGGGRKNSVSILEIIDILKNDFGLKLNYTYSNRNRIGDHICYYSDMSKFKKDYPDWKIQMNLRDIIKEIIEFRNNEII